jgi:hypothetical protein
MDNASCVTRTYSRLVEGGHKTFLCPHAPGAWPSPSRKADTQLQGLTIWTVLMQATSWGDGSGVHITWREVFIRSRRNIFTSRTDCYMGHPRPILRTGWTSDIYHSQLRNLHPYLGVGALLQNSKLLKVNVQSKTQLACHLLRLLWSIYGLIHVSSP